MSGEGYGHSGIPVPWGLIAILLIAVVVAIAGINLLTAGNSGGSADPPGLQADPVNPVSPVEPEQSEKAVINDYFSPQNIPEVIRVDFGRMSSDVAVEGLYITDVQMDNKEITFSIENVNQDKAQILSGVSVSCKFRPLDGSPYTYSFRNEERAVILPGGTTKFRINIEDPNPIANFRIGIAPRFAVPMDAVKTLGE